MEKEKYTLDLNGGAYSLYEFIHARDIYDPGYYRNKNDKTKTSFILMNDKDEEFHKLLIYLANQHAVGFTMQFREFLELLSDRLIQLEEAWFWAKYKNDQNMWNTELVTNEQYKQFKIKYKEEQEKKEYKRLKKIYENEPE
jgi:hypothetical protein